MAKKANSKKWRITIKAFDHRLLDEASEKNSSSSKRLLSNCSRTNSITYKIEKITVNRSTFVNKDAREQFEIRRHKRLIDITEPTAKTLELLQDINIPNGVWVEIKSL